MLTDISGTKIRQIFKLKLRNLKLTGKTKNIRDMYRCINDLKKGYHPREGLFGCRLPQYFG
jgi:hypothetical protein